jgi:hypothetical protein
LHGRRTRSLHNTGFPRWNRENLTPHQYHSSFSSGSRLTVFSSICNPQDAIRRIARYRAVRMNRHTTFLFGWQAEDGSRLGNLHSKPSRSRMSSEKRSSVAISLVHHGELHSMSPVFARRDTCRVASVSMDAPSYRERLSLGQHYCVRRRDVNTVQPRWCAHCRSVTFYVSRISDTHRPEQQ